MNTIKTSELKELVREIVRSIMREQITLSSSDIQQMTSADPSLDPNVAPADAQTPADKARMEREAELQRQKDIKQQQVELDSKKKEMEFNKKKLDQQRRFDIPNATKSLQALKGAKI